MGNQNLRLSVMLPRPLFTASGHFKLMSKLKQQQRRCHEIRLKSQKHICGTGSLWVWEKNIIILLPVSNIIIILPKNKQQIDK